MSVLEERLRKRLAALPFAVDICENFSPIWASWQRCGAMRT